MTEQDYRKKVTNLNIGLNSDIDKLIKSAVSEIVQQSIEIGITNPEEFSFDSNKKTKEIVDSVISKLNLQITDKLISMIKLSLSELVNEKNEKLYDIEEESDFNILSLFGKNEVKGKTFNDRLYDYTDKLKYEIESYIVIGLISGYTASKITNNIILNIKKPYKSFDFINARNKALRYKALRLAEGKPIVERGQYLSGYNGMTTLVNDTINRAYSELNRYAYILGGYKYQLILRQSNYPCDICEDTANKYYPIKEEILPNHPRCVCISIPIKDI